MLLAQPRNRKSADARPWVRVVGHERAGRHLSSVDDHRFRHHQRREARPELDDALRLGMAHHRVEQIGVDVLKRVVAQEELRFVGAAVQWRVPFGDGRAQVQLRESERPLGVQVDPVQWAASRPHTLRHRAEVRQRAVVGLRQDVEIAPADEMPASAPGEPGQAPPGLHLAAQGRQRPGHVAGPFHRAGFWHRASRAVWGCASRHPSR